MKQKLLFILFQVSVVLTVLSQPLTVTVTANSVSGSTTCTDAFLPAQVMYSARVNGAAWSNFPMTGACFQALPLVLFQQSYNCTDNLPVSVDICFRAFDNDPTIAGFFTCEIIPRCEEVACQTINLPLVSGSSTLSLGLSNPATSSGDLSLTIDIAGLSAVVNNNEPCDAFDLGVINTGTTIGDASLSNFNNFCADNANEPNPFSNGYWLNDKGVWFSFTTGSNPGSVITVFAASDPENLGDPIQLQMALYESPGGTCVGPLVFNESYTAFNGDNAGLQLECAQPNTTYYVLVDGAFSSASGVDGYFGIEVEDVSAIEGGDRRCEREFLGIVPEGGAVSLGPRSNVCAGNVDDPFVAGFQSQRSVWFSFQPPSSGHVSIFVDSDESQLFPLGAQVALYRTSNNTCTGAYTFVRSSYRNSELDETMVVSCLDPSRTYYILIDGDGGNGSGVFNISVTDLGDNTPVLNQDIVLCAGQTIRVGNQVYSTSGNYSNTIILPNGCDSIVNTNLTVLMPITPVITINSPATGLGNMDGGVTVSGSGGTGMYAYAWSPSGNTYASQTTLAGDANYCVTITDNNNCTADTCFLMPYLRMVTPTVLMDSVRCNGGTDGQLTVSAVSGRPPYNYTWQQVGGPLSGNGILPQPMTTDVIGNLPAGDYALFFSDGNTDTTFVVAVEEPAVLGVQNVVLTPVSCFGLCDGSISLAGNGGTAPYQYAWAGGQTTANRTNLCANTYNLTITDANLCTATFNYTIQQPPAFQIMVAQVQPVSCFGGMDGSASVSGLNGTIQQVEWSNNDTTTTIDNLSFGTYTVTVTNTQGCTATGGVQINAPAAPFEVSFLLERPIQCSDSEDAIISAIPNEAGAISYEWSNGASGAHLNDVAAGTYVVTATNASGCTATDTGVVQAPLPIQVTFETVDHSCLMLPEEGSLSITDASGGYGAFSYSINNGPYDSNPVIQDLAEGAGILYVQDSLGCIVPLSYTMGGPPNLAVSAGNDVTVTLGNAINLFAVVSSTNAVLSWSPDALLDCGDCEVVSATVNDDQVFVLTAIDTVSNCIETDEVLVRVNKERNVYFPTAFSPNGDGQNDQYEVFSSAAVEKIHTFRIFDRFGSMVFQASNHVPDDGRLVWDGTFKGKDLGTGVLVFMADIEFKDGVRELFRGDITLVK